MAQGWRGVSSELTGPRGYPRMVSRVTGTSHGTPEGRSGRLESTLGSQEPSLRPQEDDFGSPTEESGRPNEGFEASFSSSWDICVVKTAIAFSSLWAVLSWGRPSHNAPLLPTNHAQGAVGVPKSVPRTSRTSPRCPGGCPRSPQGYFETALGRLKHPILGLTPMA